MSKLCGAKTKRDGSSCKREAGWGTKHVGTGKCKLHGGASDGAPKGSQNALKHGIYARLYKADELEEAALMVGNIDTELAIARLQLRNLIELQQKQRDEPILEQIEETTLASDSGEEVAKEKAKRARTAKMCGEYYDPDDDDFPVEVESAPLQRKRIFRRLDSGVEFARLTKLIESLERTRASLAHQAMVTKKLSEEGRGDAGDTRRLTSVEIDAEILGLAEELTASIPL